ncbi:alpha/beta hydrolase [Rapidithrix thailandica]|uniref:Alpha/beta hydrolase n=1 Tax=Rapidithrix thailandica TaxID=413964 RepID=A0AAW9S6J1_9BACT
MKRVIALFFTFCKVLFASILISFFGHRVFAQSNTGKEQILQANGVKLCIETFGDPSHPAILLNMGAMASMLWWPADFCQQLAERGYFVIRYDSRDVGRSQSYTPGESYYTIMDLVADTYAILDACKVEKAHYVGMSMGGYLSEIAALQTPERVLSLTLISTTSYGASDPGLTYMNETLNQYFAKSAEVDWSDKEAVVHFRMEGARLMNGKGRTFPKKEARILAEMEFDRASNIQSMLNHALLTGGEEYYDRAKDITQPVLIIHGSDDPVLPFAHAMYLHKEIEHSKLLYLKGAGHEIHQADWAAMIDGISGHIGETVAKTKE